MPQSITLGGFEVLARLPVGWVPRAGVHPSWSDFELSPADAQAVLDLRGPIDLVITRESGENEKWTNLWALHATASDDPFLMRVRVYDRRWFWPYKHVGQRLFNKRRGVGFYRIEANNRAELERVEEAVQYVKSTLDWQTGKPWKPFAVLQQVASDLANFEASNGGARFERRFEDQEPGTLVEDLEIDHQGDTALLEALAQMPGMLVRVDPDGAVVFYSQLRDGAADAVLEQIGEEVVGGGHTITVSHANEAPRAIDVLFTIESELRFDYIERDSDETVEADPDEERRELKHVIPVPDYQITIDGKLVTQGTFADEARYVASLPTLPGSSVSLTEDMIRQAQMPFSGLWGAIVDSNILAFAAGGDDAREQVDWVARVAAIQQWHLRCFRLPRGWHDRVLAWSPTRIATVNQADGSRGPAMVFGGWAYVGGQRSWIRSWVEADKVEYLTSIDGYRETLDDAARPSPCELRLYNPEQGILALTYLLDPNRRYEQVLPAMADGNIRGAGFGPAGLLGLFPDWHWTFDSVTDGGAEPPRLTSNHRLAVILTAIPAAGPYHEDPSNVLFRVRVLPGDVATLPGGEKAVGQFARFRGPIKEVRVHASAETARLRWRDDRADDFAKLFGIQPGPANLDGLCMNKDAASTFARGRGAGGASFGAPLDEISRTIAYRIWSSYIEHPQGQSTGDLSFKIVPRGWTDSVAHIVLPNGQSLTRASFPERLTQLDWMPLLTADAQAVIRRLAYMGR